MDVKVHNIFSEEKIEAPKFMKFRASIIDEYAELLAQVDEVEAALDYAEYTLG